MENQNLRLTEMAREYLREGAKWAQFLAILGFIGIGFMVIIALFMGSIMSTMGSMYGGGASEVLSGGFVTVLYLLFAALYFFPVLYLFKFASNLKDALVTNDETTLETAFGYLKSHYKFIGILTIIVISIYIIFIAIAVAAFASMA